MVRFGKRGKLSPRYVVPFEVLKRLGTTVDWLVLPSVYRVFMRYSMSPYSKSTLQIQLMQWIGVSSLLMQMGPLRRDLCILWIAGIRFCNVRL